MNGSQLYNNKYGERSNGITFNLFADNMDSMYVEQFKIIRNLLYVFVKVNYFRNLVLDVAAFVKLQEPLNDFLHYFYVGFL